MNTTKTLDNVKELIAIVTDKNDRLLLDECGKLVLKEKNTQVLVILHIAEIHRRKLHLDLGLGSMFDYCQAKLNLSENETYLRTQVAAAGTRHPELLAELSEGNISLSVAGKLAPCINEENKMRLLQDCRGKSKRQVEEYLADQAPKPAPASSLRKKPVQTDDEGTPSLDFEQAENSVAMPIDAKRSTATMAPLGQERHHLRCTISEETKKKLLRLAELVGIDGPFSHLDELIEKALDLAVKAKDPAQKSVKPASRSAAPRAKKTTAKNKKKRQHIPKLIKDAVFVRAGYRCEYVSREGRRCDKKIHLQIDHKHPIFLGGRNDYENLQILCGGHNLRKFDLENGAPWVS